MLKPAIGYADRVVQYALELHLRPRGKYYSTASWGTAPEIKTSDYDVIQMVSVGYGDIVLGYFEADIDREMQTVENISVAGFRDGDMTFARDWHRFIRYLFEDRGFRKISLHVTASNPAGASYERMVRRCGGRFIGIRERHCMLGDGTVDDLILYEVHRDAYLKNRESGRVKKGWNTMWYEVLGEE